MVISSFTFLSFIEIRSNHSDFTITVVIQTFILNGKWIDPKSELQNCCSYKRREDKKGENPVYK